MSDSETTLREQLESRILVLDGAMGTMVQSLDLDELSIRGERFRDHHKDLNRFVDILSLTRPDALIDIHREYLDAGADIICPNTFGASPVGMLDFELSSDLVREINTAAVDATRLDSKVMELAKVV